MEAEFLFTSPLRPKTLLLHNTTTRLVAVLSSSKPVSSSGVTKTQSRGVHPPLLPDSCGLTCGVTPNTSKSLKKEWWPLLPLNTQRRRSLPAPSQGEVKRVSGGRCSGSPKLHLWTAERLNYGLWETILSKRWIMTRAFIQLNSEQYDQGRIPASGSSPSQCTSAHRSGVQWGWSSLWHENDISNSKADQDGKEVIEPVAGQRGRHLKGMSISLPAVPDSRSTQAGQQGGSLLHFILLHAEIQKGHQECQLSVARRESGVWDWMRRQRDCLRGLGLAGGWTTKPTTALGNPWHGTCRGPMTIDLCIDKVRVQSLPLPQGTQGSCPISQRSLWPMSDTLFGVRILSIHPVQTLPLSRKEFMKPEEEYKCAGVCCGSLGETRWS